MSSRREIVLTDRMHAHLVGVLQSQLRITCDPDTRALLNICRAGKILDRCLTADSVARDKAARLALSSTSTDASTPSSIEGATSPTQNAGSTTHDTASRPAPRRVTSTSPTGARSDLGEAMRVSRRFEYP